MIPEEMHGTFGSFWEFLDVFVENIAGIAGGISEKKAMDRFLNGTQRSYELIGLSLL